MLPGSASSAASRAGAQSDFARGPPGEVELIVLVAAERTAEPEKASLETLARWDAAAAAATEIGLDPRSFRELTLEERRAPLRRLRGVGRGLLPSSQEFLRQKREEVELGERKLAR